MGVIIPIAAIDIFEMLDTDNSKTINYHFDKFLRFLNSDIEDEDDYNETTYSFQCMNKLYNDKINSLHIINFKDTDLEILFRNIIKYIDKFCKRNSIIMFIFGNYKQYATELEILDKFYKNEYKKNQKILFSNDKYSTFIGESHSIEYMLDNIIEKFYIFGLLGNQLIVNETGLFR